MGVYNKYYTYILKDSVYIIIFNHFRKLIHGLETMLQQKSEVEETSENFKEKIEFVERERADINNKINYFTKEMERERISFKSKYDALQK